MSWLLQGFPRSEAWTWTRVITALLEPWRCRWTSKISSLRQVAYGTYSVYSDTSVYVYVYLYKYKLRTYTNIVNSSHNPNQSRYGLVAYTRPEFHSCPCLVLEGIRITIQFSVSWTLGSTQPPAPQGHLWGWPNLIRPNQPPVGMGQKSQCLRSPGRWWVIPGI